MSQPVWKRLRNSYLLNNPDLLLICLGVFVTFLGMGVVLPVRNLYAEQTGSSPDQIGWMTAAFFGATFLFLLPCGWLTDRFGRKNMLAAGLGLSGVVPILFLIFTSPWAFIGLRFVEGIGAAALIPAARAYLGDVTVPERRGEAYGAFSAAWSIGLLIGPGLGTELALFGYAVPFLLSSAMAFLVMTLSLLRVDDQRAKENLSAELAEKRISMLDRRLLNLNLWGPMTLTFGRNIALGLFNVLWSIWLNDLAHAQGLSEAATLSLIGLSYTAFALPQLFFQPFAGRFADRHRRVLLILIPGIFLGGVYTIYGLLTSLPLICLFAFVEGTLVSFFQPATDSYLIDVSPEEARGLIQGLYYAIGMVGGFISAIVTPELYGRHGAHRLYPFIFLALTTLLTTFIGSAIVAHFDPRKKHKPRITNVLPEVAAIRNAHSLPALNNGYGLTLPEEDPSSGLLTSN